VSFLARDLLRYARGVVDDDNVSGLIREERMKVRERSAETLEERLETFWPTKLIAALVSKP
jgi:hypothetical protein